MGASQSRGSRPKSRRILPWTRPKSKCLDLEWRDKVRYSSLDAFTAWKLVPSPVSLSLSPFWSPAAVFREATTDFTVDARPLSPRGGDHVKAEVRNPSGALTDCSVTDNADGTYGVQYTPFENGSIRIRFEGLISNSRAVSERLGAVLRSTQCPGPLR